MKIFDMKQFEQLKGHIAPEILNNPAFSNGILWKIENYLDDAHEADIEISEDGKKVVIYPGLIDCTHYFRVPSSRIAFMEIELTEDGMIRFEDGHAVCYDEKAYREHLNQPYDTTIKVNFNPGYECYYYDSCGIEMSHHTYGKGDWGLTGVRYDDLSSLRIQLLAKGFHRPRTWTHLFGADTQVQFDADAFKTDTVRSYEHPCIIDITEQKCSGGFIIETHSKKAHIHYEYPAEIIRIDHYDIFAESNGSRFVPTEDYRRYYGDISYEDLLIIQMEHSIDGLDGSKTREWHPEMYEELRRRTVEANKEHGITSGVRS